MPRFPQVGGKPFLDGFREQLAEGEASERSFGLVVSGALVAAGLVPLVRHGAIRFWPLVLAAVVLMLTLTAPRTLRAPKRAWLFFGFLMALVINPIVIGVLYYLIVTPFGILMRLAGHDPLLLKPDPNAASYWKPRTEPSADMTEQF